ncbi:UNVERIFIED_ORG: membrane fusion protein (multidrug efflux system) [Martelella mediterranea]
MRSIKAMTGIILIAGAGFAGFELTGTMLAPRSAPAQTAPSAETALEVSTVPVRQMAFSETIAAVGTTRAIRAIELHPEAAGRIVELSISPGSTVSEGDLLLRLDDTAARASLEFANATLAEARAAIERHDRLRESGTISEAAYEAAQAALLRAEAERDLAREALEDRSLYAPFTGVVGLSDLTVGEHVDTNTIVASLDDLSVIEVDFRVPEQAYPRLDTGIDVELHSASWPDRIFRGAISAIDTRIDAGSRSLALRARVDNADGDLKAGMFMQVAIVIENLQQLAVPERALSVSGAQTTLFVVDAGIARQVEIETGQNRDGLVEVRAGLENGDAVIINNLHRLSDGMAVTPRPATATTAAAEASLL